MKRFWAGSILVVILLLFPLFVDAQDNQVASSSSGIPTNFRGGEVTRLESNETIDGDYFSAGERVVVAGTVNNDAYVAGGNVDIDGTINGDLLVAGGNVHIRGTVNGDIRAVGGNIEIEGKVGKNITVMGGSINLDRDAQIAGNVVIAGGNIDVRAPVAGKGTIAGGNVMIASTISSDVNVGAGKLSLEPGAQVLGNLTYWSEEQAEVASDASVSGKLTFNKVEGDKGREDVERAQDEAAFGFDVYKILVGLLMGSLLIWAFPNFSKRAADEIRAHPFKSFGFGFLFLILVPILGMVLLITLIGIPLAFILFLGYILALLIAQVFTSLALGEWVMNKIGRKSGLIAAFIVGLIILSLVKSIPFIGGFVGFISLMVGLGALMTIKYRAIIELRNRKIL